MPITHVNQLTTALRYHTKIHERIHRPSNNSNKDTVISAYSDQIMDEEEEADDTQLDALEHLLENNCT
jgi:ABC-type molybdenum transport system ATPase subunit/photorepair protein PhrA